ncbi:hypothetical protein [Brevibacillus dissolubilis]|uniref:hypothetical protein n=1 Tax=Brevibacillus dissolubilis TaxID=1844116 RepID=UPI001116CC5D|nr:hypothetical protein [Brevibacillus dissolubilis]
MKKMISGFLGLTMIVGFSSAAFANESTIASGDDSTYPKFVKIQKPSLAVIGDADEVEPNNTPGYADEVPEGNINGVVSGSGDIDWFFFNATDSVSTSAYVFFQEDSAGNNLSGTITLYKENTDGTLTRIGSSTGEEWEYVDFNAVEGKNYYVKITTSSSKNVPYMVEYPAF